MRTIIIDQTIALSFVAYDDPDDTTSGYFTQGDNPLALFDAVDNNGNYLSDEQRAYYLAKQVALTDATQLPFAVKGCEYDIRLHGVGSFAWHFKQAALNFINSEVL